MRWRWGKPGTREPAFEADHAAVATPTDTAGYWDVRDDFTFVIAQMGATEREIRAGSSNSVPGQKPISRSHRHRSEPLFELRVVVIPGFLEQLWGPELLA